MAGTRRRYNSYQDTEIVYKNVWNGILGIVLVIGLIPMIMMFGIIFDYMMTLWPPHHKLCMDRYWGRKSFENRYVRS